MVNVGITGQNGFVGKYLYNTLSLDKQRYNIIPFERHFFENSDLLDVFVSKCDVIIHLAGLNRHESQQVIYDTNIDLSNRLCESLTRTKSKPHIIISSSTQEERDNLYGQSKKAARTIISKWARENGAIFTGLIIPKIFGPFGAPFYNSVVATFCYQLNNGMLPSIQVDSELKLIYVAELVSEIIKLIDLRMNDEYYLVEHTTQIKVSDILKLLLLFKDEYLTSNIFPEMKNKFELNLFNTFRSYIQLSERYPIKYKKHIDQRGSFSEIIKLNTNGQVSFSTTYPGIKRGNHFHTRKIERFAVISGKALIQLRQIGYTEVHNFYLDGEEPAFVDMPVWWTHNISNIGNTPLYTIFWINEFYDPNDPDTYIEEV